MAAGATARDASQKRAGAVSFTSARLADYGYCKPGPALQHRTQPFKKQRDLNF